MARTVLRAGVIHFVCPEDVDGVVEEGFYLEVTSCARGEVFGEAADEDGPAGTLALPIELAVVRTVPFDEPAGSRVSTWLRRGVACASDSVVLYGQVVATAGDQIQVAAFGGARWHALESVLGQVEPVLAMLLSNQEWPGTTWDADAIAAANNAVRQLLGPSEGDEDTEREPPTVRQLTELLSVTGVRGEDTQLWLEPATGLGREPTLTHALRFSFYTKMPLVSGDRADQLGSSICGDPSLNPALRAARSILGKRRTLEFFGTQELDDLEETKNSEPPRPPGTSAGGVGSSMAQGAGYPTSHWEALVEAQRAALAAQAVAATAVVDRPPVDKHRFNAPQVRVDVHRALTHLNHVGKTPPCFIEELLSSSSVQFRRDPGVLVRVYDFLFGRRGLSIMHFSPMTVDEHLAEAESLDCSTEDYSPSVKAAPAKKPVEWSDIQDAVAGFIQYTVEYCDPVSVRVGLALVPFVSSMQTGGTWPKRHLQTLVFWINSQLLAYRDLAHTEP